MKSRDIATGSDITREWRALDTRARQLPPGYQPAWGHIRADLLRYSGFRGRNLTPILDAALVLLEEAAADGQTGEDLLAGIADFFAEGAGAGRGVRELSGDDVAAFCDGLIRASRT